MVQILTFAVLSGQPDSHPGQLHIEEIRESGSLRSLQHGLLNLYEPEIASADLGYLIAGAIYNDLTAPRQGRYKGSRFDFQSDCEIHLVQKTGADAGRPSRGGNARYHKAQIGIARVPGGLSRDEVCSVVARTFNSGWQRLSGEAYVHPSQIASEAGGVIYDRSGWRFTGIVRLESNFRFIIAPLVFLACQDVRITEFATLHQGHGQGGRIIHCYRRYGFLYTPQGIWLTEKGTFPLSTPIRIPRYHPWDDTHRREEGDTQGEWEIYSDIPVIFWHLPNEGIQVIGGLPPYSDFPASMYFKELEQQLQTAYTNCSIYCSECGRDYRPDITRRELEVFSSRGDLLDVCAHCFYCVHCHRWSTPTERDRALTWNDQCEHIKRRGARSVFGHFIPNRDLAGSKQATAKSGKTDTRAMQIAQTDALEQKVLAASSRPSTVEEDEVQIEYLQRFAALSEKLQIEREQSIKSLALFWRQVECSPGECWRWRGDRPNTILYHGASGTHRVDVFKLAWALGTGQVFPAHSKTWPTCETSDCINPAHKIETIGISDVWWWLCPRDKIGEDDWQEIAYRFKQSVDEGKVPSLQQEGETAVRRTDFDSWMQEEGDMLIAEFSYKYRQNKVSATSRAKGSGQSKNAPAQGTAAKHLAWWEYFGLTPQQAETQVKMFQEIVEMESDSQQLDQVTAQRNLERFYSRIAIRQGGCWAWTWQEPQFRLFKFGPWIDPRELAWWLVTGTRYRGLSVHIASHNGRSWCLNPAHSDVEFATVSAALFLIQISASPAPVSHGNELRPLDEPVQKLRHRIHQAIERREIPYRLNERTHGLQLWRSDILAWWKLQQPTAKNHYERQENGSE